MIDKQKFHITFLSPKLLEKINVSFFNVPSQYIKNSISVPWLLRFGKLFESICDVLNTKFGIQIEPVVLQTAWLNDGLGSTGSFSSSTGRLFDSSKLAFLKKLDARIDDAAINDMYRSISIDLKSWDEWYLSSIGNRIRDIVGQVAPTGSSYANLLISTSYFEFGSDPGKLFKPSKTKSGIPVYVVEFMEDRAIKVNDDRSSMSPQPPGSSAVIIDGPITTDSLIKFAEAKDSGKDAAIIGNGSAATKVNNQTKKDVSGGTSIVSPLLVRSEEVNNQLIASRDVSNTPILDWLSGADRTDAPGSVTSVESAPDDATTSEVEQLQALDFRNTGVIINSEVRPTNEIRSYAVPVAGSVSTNAQRNVPIQTKSNVVDISKFY